MPNPFGDEQVMVEGNPFGDDAQKEQSAQSAVDYFGEKTGELGGNFASQAMSSIPLIGRQFMGMLRSKEGPKVDKAKQALSIIEGPGSDKQRIKQLKQLFPAAKFGFSKNDGRFMVVGGKKLQLFEKGTENYPQLPVEFVQGERSIFAGLSNIGKPGMLPQDYVDVDANRSVVPSNDRFEFLLNKYASKGSVGIGGAEVKTLDKKRAKEFMTKVKRGTDVYGNETITIKSPIMGMNPGTYYLDKPGMGFDNAQQVTESLLKAKEVASDPATRASIVGGGLGAMSRFPVLNTTKNIAAGTFAGETGQQAQNVLEGKEFDAGKVASKTATAAAGAFLFTGGSKVAGRIINSAKNLFNKGVKLDKAGNLNPQNLVKELQKRGLTHEQAADEIIKNSGINPQVITPQMRADVVRWLKTGNIPTQGQILKGAQGARERELYESGEKTLRKATDVKGKVQAQSESLLNRLKSQQQGTTIPREEAGRAAQQSLGKSGQGAIDKTDKAYSAFRNSPGTSTVVNSRGLSNRVKQVIDDNPNLIPVQIRSKANKILSGKGVKVRDIVDTIQVIDRAARATTDPAKLSALMEIRSAFSKTLGGASKKMGPESMKLLSRAKKSYQAERKEYSPQGFKTRAKGLRGQQKLPENLTQQILKGAADGKKIPAEKIHEKLLAAPNNQARQTIETLKKTKGGRSFIEQHNNRAMSRLVKEIEKTFKGEWNPNKLDAAIKKVFGHKENMGVHLSKAQVREINNLRKISPADFGNQRAQGSMRNWINSQFKKLNIGVGKAKGNINLFEKGARKTIDKKVSESNRKKLPTNRKPGVIGGVSVNPVLDRNR